MHSLGFQLRRIPSALTLWQHFLHKPLNLWSRFLLVLAAGALAASLFFPIWKIRLVAPQYRSGLNIHIYAYKLDSGNNGQDLVEVNLLNHYIGMRPLAKANFLEMQWMPFVFGLFLILILRAAAIGNMTQIVDLAVLFSYFGLFSLGTFAYRMYQYGHDLDTTAPMAIEPFTPVMFGMQKIANFTQSSYPEWGAYLLFFSWIFVLLSGFASRNEKLL